MILCALACAAVMWQFAPAASPEDPVLADVARHAALFWENATLYVGRETWQSEEPATAPRPRRFHLRSRLAPASSSMPAHQVVSYYAFSTFRKSPEALREFRRVVSIDGRKVKGDTSLEAFESGLEHSNDSWRQKLLDDFEDASEGATVTDFGQILLLFTKAGQHHYQFRIARYTELDNQPAIVLTYEQASGNQSVRFVGGSQMAGLQTAKLQTEDTQPLRGELWVRQRDHLPLKVTMTATHKEGGAIMRDEAEIVYAPLPDGPLLPQSVTHSRYATDKLISKDTLRYSDWQRLPSR